MKFRIWNKNLKRYATPDEWYINGEGEVFFHDRMDGDLVKAHPDNITIQRYTELKDRNYNEIYEGDIVTVVNYIGEYIVNYSFGKWMLNDTLSLTSKWIDNTKNGDICNVTVIGNINK